MVVGTLPSTKVAGSFFAVINDYCGRLGLRQPGDSVDGSLVPGRIARLQEKAGEPLT